MVRLRAKPSHKCKANLERLNRDAGMPCPLSGVPASLCEGIACSSFLQDTILVKSFLNNFLSFAAIVYPDIQDLCYSLQE